MIMMLKMKRQGQSLTIVGIAASTLDTENEAMHIAVPYNNIRKYSI